MPSNVYWLEKPWIMSADYSGRVTVQDFEQVMEVCLRIVANQPVYFVVDLAQGTSFPLSIGFIPSLIELCRHPNSAAFAWVGANRFGKVSIPMVVTRPNRFFDNREDALEFLRERVRLERTETRLTEW